MSSASETVAAAPRPAVSRRAAPIAAAVVVLVAAVLLFARLGHYALWDDEAGTALEAKGILRTGDTSARPDDHNIAAYRAGAELWGLRNRYMPPLQSYLAAPFLWLGGTGSALAARFVFALLGLATFALLAAWMIRARAAPLTILLVGLGLCCNVSLVLYLRQCRYYAPAILLSALIVFVYTRDRLTRRDLGLLSALSALLFATNYLNYAALYACLALDYAVWGRRRHKLAPADWAILLLPQIVAGAVVGFVWDPLAEHVVTLGQGRNWAADRIELFFLGLGAMDASEFYSIPVMVAAIVVAARPGAGRLRRGMTAAVCYALVTSVLSPQSLADTYVADIRYFAPVIPLAVAIEAGVILRLAGRRRWIGALVGLAVFTTNLGNPVSLLVSGPRSTIASYLHELADPPNDPYSLTAAWIRGHVPAGASVWVTPDYATFPLIFHAPDPVYAWQLSGRSRDPQYAELPAIYFRGRVSPDFIVVFGPEVLRVGPMLEWWKTCGVSYEREATLDVFFKDLYRPELYWRKFRPVTSFDRRSGAIYVFRKTSDGCAQGLPMLIPRIRP